MLRLILITSAVASLSARATSFQQDAERYQTFDCVGIENETTRQEAALARARQDGVEALGTAILVDETLGDIENELSLIDEEAAQIRLQELNRLREFKQCQ